MNISLSIVRYCAQECKRQRSGEMSVYNMVSAWDFVANQVTRQIDSHLIQIIANLVEPQANKAGYRIVPVFVGHHEMVAATHVPRLVDSLIEAYYGPYYGPQNEYAVTKEDQFYFDFEQIHPFVDGNGRTGKILYNYLSGTMDSPIMPPNFFGVENL